MHIRRGDFVKLGRDLDFSYYVNAIEKIENVLNEAIYFVFSENS